MSNKENEVLANFATRKKRAKRTMRENASKSIKLAPNAPATQTDFAGVYQVVAQLIQQQ